MTSIIDQTFNSYFSAIQAHLPPEKQTGVRPEQRKVIESVLANHNTLALMPTGSGKSLTYWIAGTALKGITLVIFPLTALMDEQAAKLESHGRKVFVLHSGISAKKQYDELIALYNSASKPDFIFVSPERLATDGFLEFVLKHIKNDIKLVVIDEAHCISEWGFDFRPFYKAIPKFLDTVFGTSHRPIILGLTATLSTKDQEEICRDFNIDPIHVIKSKQLLRHTINLSVVKVANENEKDDVFWDTLSKHKNEKLLVYVDRKNGKRSVTDLSNIAVERGFSAAYFHGDMSSDEKSQIIDKFKAGDISVVFATSAFGMGIDIPDIRGVIHYLLPESIEQYYQQVGRVGRDGKSSWAMLFFSDKNVQVRKTHYIEKSFPTADDITNTFEILTNFEVGKKTFRYFAEESAQHAFHYLTQTNLVQITCKGISNLHAFQATSSTPLPKFEQYLKATRKGGIIRTAKKTGEPECQIVENMYHWIAIGTIKATRSPEKILVIKSLSDTLPDSTLSDILASVAEKKAYRHARFDEFVSLLDSYTNSTELHQEIGRHLGVDKFQLGKIYQTLSGDMVRSKSEVIISNLLFERGIPFEYEKTLTAPDGSQYCPDFTVTWRGKRYFWEHWGLRDVDEYRQKMDEKIAWYNKHFPGQLISTEESSTLSRNAEQLIHKYFSD